MCKRLLSAFGVAFLGLSVLVPGTAGAQGITSEQAQELLNELRQIRQLLERMQPQAGPRAVTPPPPDERVRLPVGNSYSLGKPDAPLTLVEFTDYECPFCRQFHITTFEQLKKNYIETGKLRFISRDFPLEFHRHALAAAHAARCAGEQGQYWQLRHVLIVNANRLGDDDILTYARDLGLQMEQFRLCLAAQKYAGQIQQDLTDGRSAGVSGTPTFVLGRASADGIEGIKMVGALPYNVFDAKIREQLSDKP